MLQGVLRNPEIEQFLKHFPKLQWEKSLELALCIGVQTVYRRFPYGFTLDMLQRTLTQGDTSAPDSGKTQGSESPGSFTGRSHATAPTPEHQYAKEPVYKASSSPRRREIQESKRLRIPERQAPISEKPKSHCDPKRLPKHLKDVPSRIREEVKRDIERFHSTEDDSRWETRIKPYRTELPSSPPKPSLPQSQPPATRSKPGSTNSSLLVEPKTNTAYAEKLTAGERRTEAEAVTENSVLRITDKFLSDPFMATLSSQTSPKDAQARPRRWGYS